VWQEDDGSWRGRVEFPRNPVTGKRVRRYVRGKSKAKVNAKIKTLLEKRVDHRALSLATGRHRITVGEWLTRWLDAGAGGVAVKTLNRYRGLAKYQIIPALGHIPLADLRAEHVRAAWDVLAQQPARARTGQPIAGSTLSDATLRQAQTVLRKAVADAVFDDVIPRDYLRGRLRTAQPRPRTPGRALTLDEARALLAAAEASDRPARWLLALTTGVRQAEALGLGWPAIDWDRHRVDVDAQLHYDPWRHGCPAVSRCAWYRVDCHSPTPCPGGVDCPHRWHAARNRPCPMPRPHATCPPGGPCAYTARMCPNATGGPHIVRRTKSHRDRIVVLTPATVEALRTLKQRQDVDRRAAGDAWERRPDLCDLVFTGPHGQPVNPRADHAEWKRLLAAAGVPEARLHDARHTAATILTTLGVDSAVIQRLLGHSSIATTSIYQDLTAELLQPAMDAMHAALTGTDQNA
jgi:integrase